MAGVPFDSKEAFGDRPPGLRAASSTLLTVLVIPAIYVVLRDDAEELPPVEGGEAAA